MQTRCWYPCYRPLTVPGFYATHYAWDTSEGSFIGVDYFDGSKWEDNFPLLGYAGPFDTLEEARKWAESNDCSS